MTRRDLLKAGAAALGSATASRVLRLRSGASSVRFAIISDLHHGLAPDARVRFEKFLQAVQRRHDLDLVIQLGDFCYSEPASQEVLVPWKRLSLPKLSVLGNHDMDKCDKQTAMSAWGMEARFGAAVVKGIRFVWLDLNHFKKGGQLVPYSGGNYFTSDASHNWADPEQLEWLASELRTSREPVILLSHQPLGFAQPGQPVPPEQREVLDVVDSAAKDNPAGAVAACLCGHLHVDRVEMREQVPCVCVNSASYFWHAGMQHYSKPLFAMVEITSSGLMKIQGVTGGFVVAPPASSDAVIGRSPSIKDRTVKFGR